MREDEWFVFPLPSIRRYVSSRLASRAHGAQCFRTTPHINNEGSHINNEGSHINNEGSHINNEGSRFNNEGSHINNEGLHINYHGALFNNEGLHINYHGVLFNNLSGVGICVCYEASLRWRSAS